jgi:hypothetical protein
MFYLSYLYFFARSELKALLANVLPRKLEQGGG